VNTLRNEDNVITRKGIVAAFELITNDRLVKTVTYFIDLKRAFTRIERVRITRVSRGRTGQDFRVQLGRCNYAEREYLKRFACKGMALPKFWLVPVKRNKKK
jgi:hypothetical protein